MYNHVEPTDVAEIVREHLESGRPVRALMERRKETGDVPEQAEADATPETDGDS